MDLRRIENIIRIAEEKNITRAADKLFISDVFAQGIKETVF